MCIIMIKLYAGYFMSISHGVNKTAIVPPPLPLNKFSPGLFVLLQEILYQPFFALIIAKNNAFSKFFSFNLFLVGFNFAVLCICISFGTF